ncbi:MAG: carboxypeptidase regulatory-like domain-containing protein [Chloracidobacterium sp.]|nr:carboxypeptidase regulatory-like domain-containing protein [Chloracidobacterium sp.]
MRPGNFGKSFSLVSILIISAFAASINGQAGFEAPVKVKAVKYVVSTVNASVEPVFFTGGGGQGNPSCSTLNASSDPRFSHIVSDNELKLDFSDPNGTYPFTSGSGRIVVGPQNADKTVTINSGASQIFSWSSTMAVTAVIMKLGPNAYVYPYKPSAQSDSDLDPGASQGLSHVTFCYGDPLGPTAGDGMINGRVIDQFGNGIGKAQLILINGATGEAMISRTNPFGYYSFQGLDINEIYVLNVSHHKFAFGEKQRIVSLWENLTDVHFTAVAAH